VAEPFELQVQRWRDNELKLILLQREAQRRHGQSGIKPTPIVAVWGAPLHFAQEAISLVLRSAGVARGVTGLRGGDVLLLKEDVGVRLAVLLLALKPLRKPERIRHCAEAVLQLSPEACCYWLGKVAGGQDWRTRQRHTRALRLLLAEE